jgi:hypothetical protein
MLCLEIVACMGFGGAIFMFFSLTVRFLGNVVKIRCLLLIIGNVLLSIVRSEAKNDMEVELLKTSNGGSSLYGGEELA